MNPLRSILREIHSFGHPRALKREIDEELHSHIEQRISQNISDGMSPEDAAREARKRFGNLQTVREQCREFRGLALVENLLQDFRFGLRVLLKRPGSLLPALAALTLGIGLVTVMLCAINALMFRGLPLPEPRNLVSTTVPAWAFQEVCKQQTTFDGLVSFGDFHANFRALGKASRREACFITANFLDVLRGKPEIGRDFRPGEDSPAAAPVAILSHKLWLEEFQGSPAALGATIWVDGTARTIVGVMPMDFRFPINDDLWIPAEVSQSIANRETGFVFGRLKPGVKIAAARAELNTIWTRLLPPRRPGQPAPPPIRVGAYTAALTGALYGNNYVGAAMGAMLLVTLFVLFLACANVALLTLGRAIKRGQEFAVRGAMGASRRRLVIQLLAENLILFAGGAFGGTLAADVFMNWIISRMPADTTNYRLYPSWWRFEIDHNVLILVAALTFVVNLLAGLWPALQATRRDPNELLKGQTLGSSRLGVAGFQRLLVISQVSASLVILVGAFAVIQERRKLDDVHLPFDPKTTLTLNIAVSPPADPARFFSDLDRNLSQLPGVQAVALASEGFAFWHGVIPIEIEGRSYPRVEDRQEIPTRVVTPDYFQAMNLPLLKGRGFQPGDRAGSELVAFVNNTFARQYLSPGEPLGQRFRQGTNQWVAVVGCVPDAVTYGPDGREPVIYMPFDQHPQNNMRVLLRGGGKSAIAWSKEVESEIARLQPDLPVSDPGTVQQELDGVGGGPANALMLGACGAASLFLAALGIFGLITLSVNQRTKEIGIRLALGSTQTGVTMTILKEALPQIGAGLAIGMLVAVALVRILRSVLPATSAQPGVYIAVIIVLGLASVIAVLIPAIRGSKVEPMTALRYE